MPVTCDHSKHGTHHLFIVILRTLTVIQEYVVATMEIIC